MSSPHLRQGCWACWGSERGHRGIVIVNYSLLHCIGVDHGRDWRDMLRYMPNLIYKPGPTSTLNLVR